MFRRIQARPTYRACGTPAVFRKQTDSCEKRSISVYFWVFFLINIVAKMVLFAAKEAPQKDSSLTLVGAAFI